MREKRRRRKTTSPRHTWDPRHPRHRDPAQSAISGQIYTHGLGKDDIKGEILDDIKGKRVKSTYASNRSSRFVWKNFGPPRGLVVVGFLPNFCYFYTYISCKVNFA